MARMTNLYDTSKCSACRGCVIACKDWNQLPGEVRKFSGSYDALEDTNGDTFTIIKMLEHEDPVDGLSWNFVKYQCMHCFDPACKQVCPAGVYSITEWGAVVQDLDKCIGCRYCEYGCPFMIPKYRKRVDLSTKCTLCNDLVGQEDYRGLPTMPACARTCPTDALVFGERNELMRQAEDRARFLQANGFPRATIYGKLELGGLNKIYVLTDTPDKFGLPVDPKVSGTISGWQNWIQPYAAWLIPLALAGSAISFVTTRLLANKYGDHDEAHQEGGHE